MGGLAFLSPAYLLAALAVAVPIALHLFRRRTDTVIDFPAVRLLAHSPVENQRRKRLREMVLLALRVSALVLLAGSFARPYLAGTVLSGDTPVTVVALDTSFSMSAPAVFDRARAQAIEAIREAPDSHAVGLLAFDDAATTVVAPTTDRDAVVSAVGAIVPGVLPTRFGAALARAAELVGGRQGRVVVVTDVQQSGWEGGARAGIADDIEVTVRPVEAAVHNLAVTAIERRGAGPSGRIAATVQNFGLEQQEVTATLSVDGTEHSRATLTVPAQAALPVVFDAAVPETGGATVSVDDAEGMPADNQRHLVLEPAARARVTVVVADPGARGGGLYVQRALEVADRGRAFEVTVADGRAFSGWTPEQVTREQALIVVGTRTLDRAGRSLVARYLAAGGAVWLAFGADVDPGTLADVIGRTPGIGPDVQSFDAGGATLVAGDSRHPIFRRFAEPSSALAEVTFLRYRPIDEAGRLVLARFSGGAPALLEEPVERGRLLLFASDLDNQWNRFPLSPAFVPFVVESAKYLTEGAHAEQSWLLPSRPATVAAVPGVVMVAGADGDSRRVALNVDTRESNPWPMPTDAFLAAVPRVARNAAVDPEADARKAEREQRLWQMGLVAMFLALAGEGLVGRRAG